jgi:2-polyprenyl-6-methoxyphenol hydroxylase-like FAD-dependent oxidoreductase
LTSGGAAVSSLGADAAYDVAIVGARVAGALLAILLGQQGRRVLLVDRATFPSDTLSTHFFRAPALRAFRQAGVLDDVPAGAPHLAWDHNVVDGIVFPEPVTRPEDFPFYLCLRRIVLDDILARRARRTANVQFTEGALVDRLLRQGDAVGGIGWTEAGERRQASARVVVGADGVHSWLARQVSPATEHQEPVNRAMYYGYYQSVDPSGNPAAEFHYRGNHLVYCFPCDGGLTLVAASVPASEFGEFRRDPPGRLTAEINAMVDLAPRMLSADRVGRVLGSGSIPGYLRVPYGDGWALVGDAAMVMDPWSGQGIDQASTHAVLLAQCLGDFLDGRSEWGPAMKAYHDQRNGFSLETFRRTCTFGRDVRPMTRAALERRGLIRGPWALVGILSPWRWLGTGVVAVGAGKTRIPSARRGGFQTRPYNGQRSLAWLGMTPKAASIS